MRKAAEKTDISFENILDELNNISKDVTISNYIVKELTIQQFRKNVTVSLEPVLTPAKTWMMFNEFIRDNIMYSDDTASVYDNITVAMRPYLINVLRKATIGDEYKEGEEIYKIYNVVESDLEIDETSDCIEMGNIKIYLEAPSLERDNKYNNALIGALNQYKGRVLSDQELLSVGEIYGFYELLKYIVGIEMEGKYFDSETLSINAREKFLNRIPVDYANEINKFIKKIKSHERKAFSASNENGSVDIDMAAFFVANGED